MEKAVQKLFSTPDSAETLTRDCCTLMMTEVQVEAAQVGTTRDVSRVRVMRARMVVLTFWA